MIPPHYVAAANESPGIEAPGKLEAVDVHGNMEEALECIEDLLVNLSLVQAHSVAAKKVADGMAEFKTYIRNKREFIRKFAERYRNGETISTAFVESIINQVVSKLFVTKQSMQWTLRGAHL